jgi:NAD(P)-dependent dehydrogenase (short-subunit alcohol dehydrogenase family)
MKIDGKTALVTGANRGIGKRIVAELIKRGVRKVYAAARNAKSLEDVLTTGRGAIHAVELDITNADSVGRAAGCCTDIELLVNNAGVNFNRGLIAAPDLSAARVEMETNYFGTLSMCRAFAPVLRVNGGGMIVNVLSIVAKIGLPAMGSLSASKAAALRMTECIRAELAAQGTKVLAFLPAAIDTDMARGLGPVPRESPESAAQALCDGIEREDEELPFGARAEYVARMLQIDPRQVLKEYAAMLPR